MTITADDLRKLLDASTPGEWRASSNHPQNACDEVEAIRDFINHGVATLYNGESDTAGQDENGVWGDHPERRANARLIALAPTLARRVIAAEKLVEALRQAELTTEELCRGQSTENQCWVVLGEIRAALAEYEATTNAQ